MIHNGTNFTYYANGLRETKESNGITKTYYYDANGRLANEEWSNGLHIKYEYGIMGIELMEVIKGDSLKVFRYVTDSMGNVIEIKEIVWEDEEINDRLKCRYDAWGNVKIDVDSSINLDNYTINLSELNAIYYRGYYYDKETEFYYLQTRYYDPSICRFINPDTIDYLDPENINGLNLYAYCMNNPVMNVDPTGHSLLGIAVLLLSPISGIITQVTVSVFSYVVMAVASIFDEDIRNDMNAIKWNPFNTDTSLVAKSSKVSFYKGVPVFRKNGSSGSFGAIFLTKDSFLGTSGHYWTVEDILKHEWGHSVQQLIHGPISFLINIGIPSIVFNHDNAPWEITADVFGKVNREYNEEDLKKGWEYLIWGMIIGPFWWW